MKNMTDNVIGDEHMLDINYELYKVFYYVATTLSFSEASRKLFISQSAVSQSVKALETRLGQTLFVRSTKKVQLTPEGEILFRHIEPAMNLIRRGESQLIESSGSGGGQLHIGASDTICRYFLVPFIGRFHKSYPNVHIKVTNSTSLGCADLLESGQVDLIFSNYPNERLSNLNHIEIVKEFQDVFLASQDFAHLKDHKIPLKELSREPILMLDRNSTTSEFLHSFFQQHQLDLVPEVELSSNDLLIDLARIGLGIAFIPDYCVPRSRTLFTIRTQEKLPKRQIAADTSQIPLTHTAEHFLDLFRKNAPAGTAADK